MKGLQPLTNHENVYILDNLENGYKLVKDFVDANHTNFDENLSTLEKEGMIIVNTLTTNGNDGPNLICIDSDKLANATEDQIKDWENKKIHILDKPDEIERNYVENMIMEGRVQELPEGDITIWDPSKINVTGLFFSNAAPTITIKTKNGKVGMGVLTRQNISKDFFEKLKEVIGDDEITIDVVSSSMRKYPATNEEGSVLLEDALDSSLSYTLPEHIANVARQVGITCIYENCINIDQNPHTASNREMVLMDPTNPESPKTLRNTPFVFDPSGNFTENTR